MGFGKKKDTPAPAATNKATVTTQGGSQAPDDADASKRVVRDEAAPSQNSALLANETGTNQNDAMLNKRRTSSSATLLR